MEVFIIRTILHANFESKRNHQIDCSTHNRNEFIHATKLIIRDCTIGYRQYNLYIYIYETDVRRG